MQTTVLIRNRVKGEHQRYANRDKLAFHALKTTYPAAAPAPCRNYGPQKRDFMHRERDTIFHRVVCKLMLRKNDNEPLFYRKRGERACTVEFDVGAHLPRKEEVIFNILDTAALNGRSLKDLH